MGVVNLLTRFFNACLLRGEVVGDSEKTGH